MVLLAAGSLCLAAFFWTPPHQQPLFQAVQELFSSTGSWYCWKHDFPQQSSIFASIYTNSPRNHSWDEQGLCWCLAPLCHPVGQQDTLHRSCAIISSPACHFISTMGNAIFFVQQNDHILGENRIKKGRIIERHNHGLAIYTDFFCPMFLGYSPGLTKSWMHFVQWAAK